MSLIEYKLRERERVAAREIANSRLTYIRFFVVICSILQTCIISALSNSFKLIYTLLYIVIVDMCRYIVQKMCYEIIQKRKLNIIRKL